VGSGLTSVENSDIPKDAFREQLTKRAKKGGGSLTRTGGAPVAVCD